MGHKFWGNFGQTTSSTFPARNPLWKPVLGERDTAVRSGGRVAWLWVWEDKFWFISLNCPVPCWLTTSLSGSAMVFPVVMYGCESWTIKKAEHWGVDTFELWCWRRLLRVPWTARKSNQSIWKEINPEYSLEGLMLKLKPQYFGHLMWRTDSFEKTLMLGKIEGRGEGDDKGWNGWMVSLIQWHELGQTLGYGEGLGGLACCSPWGSQRFRYDLTTEQQY